MANRTCSVDGCTGEIKSRRWCGKHYMRWLRGSAGACELGDDALRPPAVRRNARAPIPCAVCGDHFRPRRERHAYCSTRCYEKGRSTRPSRTTGLPTAPRPTPLFAPVDIHARAGDKRAAREALRDILWSNSTQDGACWIWGRRLDRYGYPASVTTINDVKQALHRHIAEITAGHSLAGMHAHHACARRACVNPEHIMPVTLAQNVAEMLARRSYEGRIAALEQALSDASPNHPLLRQPVEKIA